MLGTRTLRVILLLWLILWGRPVVASMSPGPPRPDQVAFWLEQDADGPWRLGGEVSARWMPARKITLAGSAEAWQDLNSGELIRATASLALTVGSGKFVLQIPGMLKCDDTGTTGRLGLTVSPSWGAMDAVAGFLYERRYSDRAEWVNERLKGRLGLSLAAGPSVYSGSVEYSCLQVPALPEQDFIFFTTEGGCRFRLGPKTYLKAGAEWAGYFYPNAPRDDNSRFEVTGEWGRYLDPGRLSAGIEAEYGRGRLSHSYLYGLIWTRLVIKAGPGQLAASARLDGCRYLDPQTGALDVAELRCGAGYSLVEGPWTIEGGGHFSCRVFETGDGDWVFGPRISLIWQPHESWRAALTWAPEGDPAGNGRGLRLQICWDP